MRKFSFFLLLGGLFVVFPFSPKESFARKKGAVIRLNDIKVEGRIQKPQAFYVLHRAPLNYRNFRIQESFIKKVINSVKSSPF